jgi:hypothetical protein
MLLTSRTHGTVVVDFRSLFRIGFWQLPDSLAPNASVEGVFKPYLLLELGCEQAKLLGVATVTMTCDENFIASQHALILELRKP